MASRPNIVVLDGHTLNPGDLSWQKLQCLGQVTIYPRSKPDEVIERAKDADILLVNKVILDEGILKQLPKLRFICVTATGYNNVDTAQAKAQGIPVSNISGYSTPGVAQHVFALILSMTNKVAEHHQSVQAGQWATAEDFTYQLAPIQELAGKTMGIYGFGRIGQAVGQIAHAFGMRVLATHKHPERDKKDWVEFVDLESLFQQSQIISLHAPLGANNQGIVNQVLLSQMPPNAYLINTGRGGLINETDLKTELENGQLAGAALDVLGQEPPPADHPLIGVPNCIISPHLAWASVESRNRLMEDSIANVQAFLRGEARNLV